MDFYKNLINTILHDNVVTLVTAIAIVIVMWAIEWLRPATKDSGIKSRVENISIYTLCVGGLTFFSLVVPFFITYALPEKSVLEHLTIKINVDSFSGIVISILIYALVWDFFQYWLHRAEHKFSVLWTFHRLHHDDKSMNSSTAIRQSFGGMVLAYFIVHIPTLIICGVNFLPYVGTIILFNALGYFNHANLKISFGKLSYIFSDPHIHRLHHGLKYDYHNCNYAAFFTFYDVIFGTFKKASINDWPVTGIYETSQKVNLVNDVFFPWRKATELRK